MSYYVRGNMNIDKLTELLNKRVDYKEVVDKLKDFEKYELAIHCRGSYGFVTNVIDQDCRKLVINYYNEKIKNIEDMIKEL